jgi:hypothetical protein
VDVDQDLEVTVPFEDLRAPLQRRLAVVFGHLVVEGGGGQSYYYLIA